ncbi:MAG: helix-turn-helix domain-containing protein [Nitriliruptorales bacterium]|nr:helix-turn-helix domain-containing protein [Nitriliruptorales bacterium]
MPAPSGRPLRELTSEIVPLEEVLGADAPRLVDDLATAPDWPSRFQRLDRELAGPLAADHVPAPEVVRSWERIVAARGRVRVGDLAAEVGWSRRHLTARVREQLGLSPKRMARLARFDHATTLLSRPGGLGFADVAAATGYYDQAHFTNDVRELSGLSPTQLQARRLPEGGGVFDLTGT